MTLVIHCVTYIFQTPVNSHSHYSIEQITKEKEKRKKPNEDLQLGASQISSKRWEERY